MSTPATVPPLDTRPLVEPIDAGAARAFARQLRAKRGQQRLFSGVGGVFALIVGGFILLGCLFLSAVAFAMVIEYGQPLGLIFAIFPLLLPAAFVTFLVVKLRGANAGQANGWYRLDRFARANGLAFNPWLPAPSRPGMIFSLGRARGAHDVVSGTRRRWVEVANYTYETGSGKDTTTHFWGYLALRLDTPLPNIVLDATSNNGLFGASNLPVMFKKDQRLSLEGDFDRHFELYCPRGYEQDALYLFTPDIMARFIDNAAQVDVEIVDDWLFLYAKRNFSTLDPATWTWLFSIVDALDDKFAQWARWRDERLATAVPGAAVADASEMAIASGTGEAAPEPGVAETAPKTGIAETGIAEAAPEAADAAVVPESGVAARLMAAAAASAPAARSAGAPLTPPPAGVAQEGRRLKQGAPWYAYVIVAAFVALWLLFQSGMLQQFFSP